MSNLTLPSVFGLLDKLIVEHGSAVVQKVHIDFLRDQISALQKHNESLKAAHADLVKKLSETQRELAEHTTPTDCIPWLGVLIKRLPDGRYSDSPLCPTCKRVMSVFPGNQIYICNHCEYVSTVRVSGYQAEVARLSSP